MFIAYYQLQPERVEDFRKPCKENDNNHTSTLFAIKDEFPLLVFTFAKGWYVKHNFLLR